jgi:CNT family concentrative nucleoside transporter
MMAKIPSPRRKPETRGNADIGSRHDVNLLTPRRGAGEGLQLMLNVMAMLIAFVALVALVNGGSAVHSHVSWFPATMQKVLGSRPVAWAMGVLGRTVRRSAG